MTCDEIITGTRTVSPVDRVEVERAAERLGDRVRHTPVLTVAHEDVPLVLKLEHLQHTGSFKARGMLNRLLAAREAGELTGAGIVAASGGNAGLAAAWAAQQVGVRAEIFVPEVITPAKVDRLRLLGAELVIGGAAYADALTAARERLAVTGALEVHAYDQREVVAGQGTSGLELAAQAPVDTVLVATGGGGLVAGIAAALGDTARVVAVEPERLPTLHAALAAGGPVDIEVDTACVAADSLGARRAGAVPYATVVAHGVGSVLVSDDAIVAARRHLWDAARIVVENSGAAALAAVLSGAYVPAAGERVAAVLCGANTDPATL